MAQVDKDSALTIETLRNANKPLNLVIISDIHKYVTQVRYQLIQLFLLFRNLVQPKH